MSHKGKKTLHVLCCLMAVMAVDVFAADYNSNPMWLKQQAFLPEDMHFTDTYRPQEEIYEWNGHKIHVDRFRNDTSKAKLILLHGVGTNGRQMSLIVGGPLWKRGYECIALDMPGYGMTEVSPDRPVTYTDWVQIASDFVDKESGMDNRPIILYGLSAGGMETYHVAAMNSHVAGIVGMTFLDQRDKKVRDKTARNLFMSRVAVPCAGVCSHIPLLRDAKVSMQLASKMYALVNDKEALNVFLADGTSAGNWMSMRFLSDYMNYKPAVEPENFTQCPVLLTQPAKDHWTPLELSQNFIAKLTQVKFDLVMLDNASHYPIEEPGLKQMENAIADFTDRIVSK
ncbi:MAG: alpha/beta fold hydrolase [Desulfobacteraceae bacterium]|jgi:alpha-beta hydrolase superfamily lysophospholipase